MSATQPRSSGWPDPLTGSDLSSWRTDADLIAMSRQAHRALLNRLTAELLDAVADGDSGVPEAARLAAWLRADLLPWTIDREEAIVDEVSRAALCSDRGVLTGLQSLLAGSHGPEAARWARQIHRTGAIMLARLEYLDE